MNAYKDGIIGEKQNSYRQDSRETEKPPPGINLKYGLWKTLNRLRVESGKNKKEPRATENRRDRRNAFFFVFVS